MEDLPFGLWMQTALVSIDRIRACKTELIATCKHTLYR